MISIRDDQLHFSFPDVHEEAGFSIGFQRTLRIPDDDGFHVLPPGLGEFPLRNIDRYRDTVPAGWRETGGAMLPMFQSEAMWLDFNTRRGYPCLVLVAAGGINAVTGDPYDGRVVRRPQNYLVAPGQPWLDGFCVGQGLIRQFVAAPLGRGYTAEEQLTGRARHGGLQFSVFPLKAEEWERRKREWSVDETVDDYGYPMCSIDMGDEMGLAAGGRMRQEIYEDPNPLSVWDLEHPARCFLHIANSLVWRAITGEAPPTIPPTARQYTEAGLPWFDYFDDELAALAGSAKLAGLHSVAQLDQGGGPALLPENEPVGPVSPVVLKGNRIREWAP